MKHHHTIKEIWDEVVGTAKLVIPVFALSAAIVMLAGGCTMQGSATGELFGETDHKGHHYLIWSVRGYNHFSFVHDPDCKCHAISQPEHGF